MGLTMAERRAVPLSLFGWPEERKYPCDTQARFDAAVHLIGRAPPGKQAAIKARMIGIAKRKGYTLPESWQEQK